MLLYVHRDRADYQGRGAQNDHLDFHAAPELCEGESFSLVPSTLLSYRLQGILLTLLRMWLLHPPFRLSVHVSQNITTLRVGPTQPVIRSSIDNGQGCAGRGLPRPR